MKKLSLHKETLSILTPGDLAHVQAGIDATQQNCPPKPDTRLDCTFTLIWRKCVPDVDQGNQFARGDKTSA
jgi:hypothetical protein